MRKQAGPLEHQAWKVRSLWSAASVPARRDAVAAFARQATGSSIPAGLGLSSDLPSFFAPRIGGHVVRDPKRRGPCFAGSDAASLKARRSRPSISFSVSFSSSSFTSIPAVAVSSSFVFPRPGRRAGLAQSSLRPQRGMYIIRMACRIHSPPQRHAAFALTPSFARPNEGSRYGSFSFSIQYVASARWRATAPTALEWPRL